MAISKFIPIRKRRVAADRDRDGGVTERETERGTSYQPGSFYTVQKLIGLSVLNAVKCILHKHL